MSGFFSSTNQPTRTVTPKSERTCAACGGPHDGNHNSYCRACYSAYQASYRAMRNQRHSATRIVTDPDKVGWRQSAVCKDKTSIMYPFGEASQKAVAEIYCDKCPCKQECGEFALLNHIDDGVWGGMTENQRRRILRRGRRVGV